MRYASTQFSTLFFSSAKFTVELCSDARMPLVATSDFNNNNNNNNNGDGSGTIDIATANGPFQLINPPFPLLLAAHTSEIVTVQAVPQSSSGTVVGLVSFVCEPGQRVLTLNITALWS